MIDAFTMSRSREESVGRRWISVWASHVGPIGRLLPYGPHGPICPSISTAVRRARGGLGSGGARYDPPRPERGRERGRETETETEIDGGRAGGARGARGAG